MTCAIKYNAAHVITSDNAFTIRKQTHHKQDNKISLQLSHFLFGSCTVIL